MRALDRDIPPADSPLRWLTTALVLAFPTATLIVNRGDSYGLVLLALVGVWVWLRDGARRWLDRDAAYLASAFLAFFAVVVLSYEFGHQTDTGFRYLGRYLRFLMLVPVYLALRRYPPSPKTVFMGLALAALMVGLYAMHQVWHTPYPVRVEAQTDLSIVFGDLAATLVLCIVVGFGILAHTRRVWALPLLLLCLAGGVTALLLSGTRGAWVALPLLAPVLFTPLGGYFKRRHLVLVVLVLVAVSAGAFVVTRSGVQSRVANLYTVLRDDLIALHANPVWTAQVAGKPQCINGATFLRNWLQQATRSGAPDAKAAVVREAAFPAVAGQVACTGAGALRLVNPDSHQTAQFSFPRVPAAMGDLQRTVLMVRGDGSASLAGFNGPAVQFQETRYQILPLTAPNQAGTRLLLNVPPNGSVYLVPLESYSGEYSFTLADDSIGVRFALWGGAWRLFLTHPFLGVGSGAFQSELRRRVDAGLIQPATGDYDHPHDEYLDALANRGLLGLAALLAMLLIPARRFARVLHDGERTEHTVALAGLLTVAGFGIFGLTDTVFLHSMMITWYVMYMAIFYALLRDQTEKTRLGD